MNPIAETPDAVRIGRYALHGELASGGMATVYLGHLAATAGFSQPVAIKRLHAHFASDPAFTTMFLDEARLAARVRHPNVVPTLDVVAQDGDVYLVMEYIHGEALSRLMGKASRDGISVPLDVAVAIMIDVLEGLHAAHQAKNERGLPLDIVHRDVSPQNVLIGADGIARVFDFGIAKASGRMQTTQDGLLKGKMAYMAPEQLKGEKVDRRTDVWASGVVLWELLALRRLFVAESANDLITCVLESEVRPPGSLRTCPAALDDVVMHALARDPAARFATAREMSEALGGAITPASRRAVADWLTTIASQELEAKARRVERMETAPGSRPSATTKIAPPAPSSEEVTGLSPGRVVEGVADPALEPTLLAPSAEARKEPALPEPGDTLAGKYAIVDFIGRGGMGVVLEAEHLRMHQRVAIKFLRPELLADEDAVARFEREARNASRLTSPNVARIFDVDVTPSGMPYIVSELLEGCDLQQELDARGALPVPEAVDCILQACAAMDEAHGQGIVHRDLKPSNLFLVDRGSARIVKVLDFGISKAAHGVDFALTTRGVLLGSPRYMAPEQIEQAHGVDERADIWSLGVILFRALTGKHAFPGERTEEVVVGILSRPAPRASEPRPDLPPALCDAVDRALRKDPAERFQTVTDFARALEPFGTSRSLPLSATSVAPDATDTQGSWSTAKTTSRARGGILLAFVALAIALVALFAVPAVVRRVTASSPSSEVPSPMPSAPPSIEVIATEPTPPAPSAPALSRPAPKSTRPAEPTKPRRRGPRPAASNEQDPVFL